MTSFLLTLSNSFPWRWYTTYRAQALEKTLSEYAGETVTILSSDRIAIGEIRAEDYFQARHTAETCLKTRCLSVINFGWSALRTFLESLALLPAMILLVLMLWLPTQTAIDPASLTLAEVAVFIADNENALGKLLRILVLACFVVRFSLLADVAGFANFFGRRVKQELARHLPEIAFVGDYRVRLPVTARGRICRRTVVYSGL